MKNKASIKTLLFIMVSFYGCEDEKLLVELTPYSSNELRIDGYYYRHISNETHVQFFYRNGIMIDLISYFPTTDLTLVDESMTDNYNQFKDNKLIWQVFSINGNTIEYSGWGTSVGGGRPSFKGIGIIENDSTYCITKSINSDGKQFERNDIYHFRQFSPKPDSTNVFIK